jgi:hypothetical protein
MRKTCSPVKSIQIIVVKKQKTKIAFGIIPILPACNKNKQIIKKKKKKALGIIPKLPACNKNKQIISKKQKKN